MKLTEKTIIQHKHEIDNAKRMWENVPTINENGENLFKMLGKIKVESQK